MSETNPDTVRTLGVEKALVFTETLTLTVLPPA